MAKKHTVLVVGAGLAGSTCARLLADQQHGVTVIDQRDHIAGNAYDYVDTHGIRIHKYGPHIFHTSDAKVMQFLSRFTEWIPYVHHVKCLDPHGDLCDFPPSATMMQQLGEQEILDIFYRPYTTKMWGTDIHELDSSVLDRVKKRSRDQVGYFADQWQCLPRDGYTEMVSRMLDSSNITVLLNTSWQSSMLGQFDFVFNCMSIDQYHDYCLGILPYRSLRFHHWTVHGDPLSDVPVVNFTTQNRFTRITDWRLFPNQPRQEKHHVGTVTLEEPCDAADNHDQRFYPIKDRQHNNIKLYRDYATLTPANMMFLGRCGLYSYLDMHQAVSSTMNRVNRWLRHQ